MSELTQLSSETDPRRAIAMIESSPLSLVRSSYGDELVLGFGETRPSAPPLEDREADWMLYSRATPWVLESPMGVVLNSYRIRHLRKHLEVVEETILGVEVSSTQFRNRALGLTIGFTNGASFLFLPPEPALGQFEPVHDAWQLVMPDQRIVTSDWDEQLIFVSSSDPVPPITDAVELLNLQARQVTPGSLGRVAASRGPESTQGADFENLVLSLMASEYDVFVPTRAGSLDAMVVARDGTIIGIELKSRHELSSQLRHRRETPQIKIVTVIPAPDEAHPESPFRYDIMGNRATVYWSPESPEALENALRTLVGLDSRTSD